ILIIQHLALSHIDVERNPLIGREPQTARLTAPILLARVWNVNISSVQSADVDTTQYKSSWRAGSTASGRSKMTFFIPHHGFSQLVDPAIVAVRENNIEFWASVIEDKPNNVDLGLSTIYMDALYNTAGDPDVAHPETWDCWVASMQIQHAMFIMSRNARET